MIIVMHVNDVNSEEVVLYFISSFDCQLSTGNQNSYVCENVKYITEFQKEIELPLKNPEKICLDGCLDIFNVDSLLICKMQGGDYFWKVYNLNNNRSLGPLLRKGHAENEFIEIPVSEKSVVT